MSVLQHELLPKENKYQHVPNFFYSIFIFKLRGITKSSKISVHHYSKSLPLPFSDAAAFSGRRKGVRKDRRRQTGVHSRRWRGRRLLPCQAAAEYQGFSYAAPETPSPSFPSTKPCSLAKANCSHRAAPLQLTYRGTIARQRLNHRFPFRAGGR